MERGTMKRTVLGIVLLLLMVTVGCSQKPKQPIQLTIKSDKQVYEVAEPINIIYKLQNNSRESKKILAYGGKFELWQSNPFDIYDSYGKEVDYIGIWIERPQPTEEDYIVMKPGDILENTYRLDRNYNMKNIGNYRITCEAFGVTSNTIAIKVVGKR